MSKCQTARDRERERETTSTYGRQRQIYKVKAQASSTSCLLICPCSVNSLDYCPASSTKTAQTTQHPSEKKRKGKKKLRAGERK